jgi:two-component system response regulator GlrR
MLYPENRRASDTSVPSSGIPPRALILVVEDQPDVRAMLMTALEIDGHFVDEASNAHDGLVRLQSARYDLIISDYAMPGGTGSWMLKEAERRGLLSRTPALIVTAHPDARDLAHLEVIAKPIDLDRFLEYVRRVLSRARHSDELAAAENGHSHRVELVLYISPSSHACIQARRNLEQLLDGFESAQIKYSVCDLVRDPMAGEQDRVAFTPTLVKRYPSPRTWVLGNLRETEVIGDLLRVCGVDAKR